jgi:hypothetical protein
MATKPSDSQAVPGRSAYNRVERRMAPLSRELSGVILPHDHFGSHLDNSGKTVDEELELKNFAEAGKVLASIWTGVEIDNYPVLASYIPPAASTETDTVPAAGQKWRAAHVRESQYCLQVVRCNDLDCCLPWRSSLHHLLPCRFLPNPAPAKHTGEGIVTSDADAPAFLPLFINLQLNSMIQQEKTRDFIVPPYDLHCPSVEPYLRKRCCSVCGIYHASIKSATSHTNECHKAAPNMIPPPVEEHGRPVRVAARRQREMMVILRDHLNGEVAEWIDAEYIDTGAEHQEDEVSAQGAAVPLIGNIQQWADTPWEDIK